MLLCKYDTVQICYLMTQNIPTMDDSSSLLTWWQNVRTKEVDRLIEKAKTETLSEVENMILNPYTLQQARNQVKMLNGIGGWLP